MKSTPIKERRTRAFIKATEWLNNSTGKGYTGIYTEAGMGYERAAKKIEEANAEANKALWLTVNSKEAVIAMMQAEIDRLKAELENINKKSE